VAIDGQQIKTARNRAGLTQQALADALGVTLRTIGNWERGATVPRDKAPAIRDVLGEYLTASSQDGEPALSQATDAEILAEVAKRFSRTGAGAARESLASALFDPQPELDEPTSLDQRRRRALEEGQPVTQAAGTTSPRKPDPDPESQDDGTMEPS